MMNEKLQNLAKKIEENEELKAKLAELPQKEGNTSADHVALCQEYGIEITEDDLQPAPVELSEDELEAVTGGKYVSLTYSSTSNDNECVECFCAVGGGGDGAIIDGTKYSPCACVVGGGGDPTVARRGFALGEYRSLGELCACVLYGQGYR